MSLVSTGSIRILNVTFILVASEIWSKPQYQDKHPSYQVLPNPEEISKQVVLYDWATSSAYISPLLTTGLEPRNWWWRLLDRGTGMLQDLCPPVGNCWENLIDMEVWETQGQWHSLRETVTGATCACSGSEERESFGGKSPPPGRGWQRCMFPLDHKWGYFKRLPGEVDCQQEGLMEETKRRSVRRD